MTKTKYKQTEVGLIPEDWTINSLNTLLNDSPKYGVGASAVDFDYNLPTYLRITDIDEDGKLIPSGLKSVNHPESHKYFLKEGDVVLARTGASVGKSYKYDSVDGKLVFAGFLIKVSPNPSKLDSQYLKCFLNTTSYWNWVTVNSMRSGQPGINGNEYGSLPIPLPPTLHEQKAIATALSDVDALINSLDKLITKKKAIKQGAMQELLTPPHKGGRRLPGFSGDWEEKKLGELTELITKGTTPTSIGKEFTNQGVRFIKAESIDKTGNIIDDKVAFIDAETHDFLSRSKMKKDDILFTIAGVLGRIGVIQEDYLPANTNQAVAIVRLKKFLNLFVPFFFHILRTKEIEKHIETISVQGAQANFSLTDVSNIPLTIPVNSEEQKAIAKILSDMDLEIESLENKKAKFQEIKQGMMQELLTGKTRLV